VHDLPVVVEGLVAAAEDADVRGRAEDLRPDLALEAGHEAEGDHQRHHSHHDPEDGDGGDDGDERLLAARVGSERYAHSNGILTSGKSRRLPPPQPGPGRDPGASGPPALAYALTPLSGRMCGNRITSRMEGEFVRIMVKAVDADADSARGRHSVAEGADVVLVHLVGLVVALRALAELLQEAVALLEGIVQLREAVGDLHARHVQLEALRGRGVAGPRLRQGRDLGRIVVMNVGVPVGVLGQVLEELRDELAVGQAALALRTERPPPSRCAAPAVRRTPPRRGAGPDRRGRPRARATPASAAARRAPAAFMVSARTDAGTRPRAP
jgi:hypothetical protein